MVEIHRKDSFGAAARRSGGRRRLARPGVEWLEQRLALSTYVVDLAGDDGASGTATAPWRTLQHAADVVKAGDTVDVRAGSYQGFVLSWDAPTAGTSAAPITFQADPSAAPGSVVITSRNNKTPVAIDLEPGSDYVKISGFTINSDASITKAGIKATGNNDQIVNNTITKAAGLAGIFTDYANNVLIQGNDVSGVAGTDTTGHGIYVAGTCSGVVVRNNTIHDNGSIGIHINGDQQSLSEAGVVTGALVEGNRIYNNGQNGINADGLQSSVIRNNLIYGYQNYGIALYQIDASAGGKNNVLVNNTIVSTVSGAGAALRFLDGSTGNVVLNNILLGGGGVAYRISNDSLPGLVSDYNTVGGTYQSEDTGATQTLAQWRSQTGQDGHSFAATGTQVFAGAGSGDYREAPGSPTIDAGTSQKAPPTDLSGAPRPSGAGYDIGAYEYQAVADTTPPTVTGRSPAPGATGVGAGTAVTATFSEPVQSSTISITLSGPGGAVAATLTYSDSTHTATLTPSSGLAASTTYTASLSGAKDLAGNAMSGPVTWSFTTAAVTAPASSVWSQTSAADFGAGTQSGTAVTNNSGGEIQLARALCDDFSGTAPGSAWVKTTLATGGTAVCSGGVLTLKGSQILSASSFVPAALEGRISFGASPWLAFGLADGLSNGSTNTWAIFSTKGTTNTLYARVNSAGTNAIANLGALPTGYHVYRVEPVSGGFAFSIDGVRKATLSIALPAGIQLKAALQADNQTTQPGLQADWVRLALYPSSGTFTSSVLDAGHAATWGTASWTATLPAGTSLVVETSSSTDGTTWSSWAGVSNGGAVASPSGRYLRYRVRLATTVASATPVLYDIAIRWS